MEMSCKNKAHMSCSCRMCKLGRATDAGQTIQRNNEKKLRQLGKQELKKAVREMDRDQLEEIDVQRRLWSPYTD